MRNLLLKNLTSSDKKRRILSSTETIDKDGFLTKVQKRLIYVIKEGKNIDYSSSPHLYVSKVHNTKEKKESFFCKMKGTLFAVSNGHFFHIRFLHSLRIKVTSSIK